MASIMVTVEGLAAPIEIEVPRGGALLIGRDPDPRRLPTGYLSPDVPIRCLRLTQGRISANHVLLRDQPEGIALLDLRSRNGSALRLPAMQWVQGPPTSSLHLHLASSEGDAPELVAPPLVQWEAPELFPERVATTVGGWLARLGVAVEIAREPLTGSGDALALLPLADGSFLRISSRDGATVDVNWSTLLETVRVYVNQQNLRFEQEQGLEDDFVLASPLSREVHHAVVESAAWGSRLVLLGPTGVGKDRLARRYHQRSRCHDGPFVAVNCALLSEDLLYAQLFGARRGAFTGCTSDLKGSIESADGGTLFLDEVGELEMKVQKAFLRFLDSHGEYHRLGDPQPRRAKVQIVSATNAPLSDAAWRSGRFRDDLWYRLAVRVILVPPLRERREDIEAYLRRRSLRGGARTVHAALSPEALQLVLSDPWPGNFRDLDSFVERLPAAAGPGGLGEAVCRRALDQGRSTPPAAPTPQPATQPAAAGFVDASAAALCAFLEDHGEPPGTWGQMQLYNERYLKPVFVAQALGLGTIERLSRDLNYSNLARHLHIADGTTVKMHLGRYIERFRNPQ